MNKTFLPVENTKQAHPSCVFTFLDPIYYMIMAWICPKCGRPFKYETSYHSCVKVDVSTFTANKPAKIIKAFNKVLDKVRQWEDVMVAPAKTAVYLKAPSNFLSIKVTRNRIDLEFYLPEPTDEFPIYKVLQLTKTRILHCVALEDEKEVNAQLMNWIKQSYELLREKGTRKVRKSGGK